MHDNMTADTQHTSAARYVDRALYAYAAMLDDAVGDVNRDAVAIDGGTDGLAALAKVVPGLPVADILVDAVAREAVDGVTARIPQAAIAA